MLYKVIFLKPHWTASAAMDWLTSVNEKFIGYDDNSHFHTFTINHRLLNTYDLEVLAFDSNTFLLCD
jgi:hypothetical protein